MECDDCSLGWVDCLGLVGCGWGLIEIVLVGGLTVVVICGIGTIPTILFD